MGQASSTPQDTAVTRTVNWLEVVKLGMVSVAVAGLQAARWALAEAESRERRHHEQGDRRGERGKEVPAGLLDSLPGDLRRQAIRLIDYQLTPVLVDQWRLHLVQVMLREAPGPAVPNDDPTLRATLLKSLETYEQEQANRPQRSSGPQPAYLRPEGVPQRSSTPSAAQASSSRPQRPNRPDPYGAGSSSAQGPGSSAGARAAAERLVREREGTVLQAKEAATPSAPPASHIHDMPSSSRGHAHDQEEAGWKQHNAAPSSPPAQEDEDEDGQYAECNICMDALVDVRSNCGHSMCLACSKAVCSLGDRGPQCPFCRQKITSFTHL